MGTDRQPVEESCSNIMAKIICLLAWAGLATAAPQGRRLGVDTSAVVDTIISQLDQPINNAIEAALRGLYSSNSVSSVKPVPVVTSFTGTVSQTPSVTILTSGSFSSNDDSFDDYEGSANYEGQFNGFSTSSGESSSFSSSSFFSTSSQQSSVPTLTGSTGQSSVVSQVLS